MQASASTSDYTTLHIPPQFPVFGRAAGVCHQCKRAKTRCDRALPACNRCLLKKTRCVYGRQISTNNSAGGLCSGEGEDVMPSKHTRACCIAKVPLDMCYKLVGMISVALLSGVDDAEQEASLLRMTLKSAGLTATSIVQTYKDTIHSWFPIMTDDQIDQLVEYYAWGQCRGIDGMLLLSMALISQPPCENCGLTMHSNLYKAVKQSFLLLQTTAKPYLKVLQIGLLLSLFEYGHGLDRESELTIAGCAVICKLNNMDSVAESKDDTGIGIDGICRKAVIIMDCLVKLPKYSKDEQTPSDSGSNLVTADAQLDDKKIKESCGSSSNFEMLFQVAGIVREATQYIKDEKTSKSSPNSYLAVESRLRNLCYALIQAAGPNSLVFCDSIALALSFLFELNTFHLTKSQESVSAADRLAIESSRRMAVDICKSMNEIVPRKGVKGLSLIGLSTTCRAAQLLARNTPSLCGEGMFTIPDLEALDRAQHEFTQRWRVGATYKESEV
ncbi:fungal zn(2)-Cys(6) binuclear cluster domain-containing protein [Trichoderma breve]|uniref:Fungal zn(2)-Cys(6) binuclear cluster domain-containing protein n=1 Tax=Trichoderma breve TaxID=2034170 RepID=A0A9W9EC55_9HYPO|nr:fungal zn(2)-Cys(6) binuclear cluster domain-containing protein [Trichoderma breve]KAJ4864026.1 fungal zn(2)-Cys(6) binuclear cluster domain-containing protein [Trichoderma breve]